MRNFYAWIFCCLLFISSVPAWSQQFMFEGNRKRDKLSFDLVRNLMIVPVYLNGKGPYDFILDSGVGPMIITDSVLVESFDVGKMTTYTLQGAGEVFKIEAFYTNRMQASIGASYIQHIPTVLLKDDPFQISAYLGRPIHGILGSTFFHSFLIKVNYKNKKMRFYHFSRKTRKKGTQIPIEIHFRKPYLYAKLIQDGAELGPIRLLLDSGASHALSLEVLNEEPFPNPTNTIPANLGIGLNGLVSGRIGRINQLRLGRIELGDVLASYPDFGDIGAKIDTPMRNGTLGAELLSRFKVTYDYRDSLIYLKSTSSLHRPFEHDMSGLEIYVDYGKPNRYFVSRVEPGSPAAACGFQHLDEILAVNLTQVDQLSLDEIYHLLKAGPGQDVVFEVKRDTERLFMVLKLEKRI